MAARQVLLIAFAIKLAIVLIEGVAAAATGSLALLADLSHMTVDLLAVGVALWAANEAIREPTARDGHTRFEHLAVRFNAVILLGLGAFLGLEAIDALGHDHEVHHHGSDLLLVVLVRLVLSFAMMQVLRHGKDDNLNLRAVHTHARADLAIGAGLLVGMALLGLGAPHGIDALLALGIAGFLLWSGAHLLRAARHDRPAQGHIIASAPR